MISSDLLSSIFGIALIMMIIKYSELKERTQKERNQFLKKIDQLNKITEILYKKLQDLQ